MVDTPLHPGQTARGRGARSNESGRFETYRRIAVDDGWLGPIENHVTLRTELRSDSTKTVIARNRSPDLSFDRSINPYRGCEHGCTYCFARPTHAFLGLSPGLDFETKILAKPEAATLLTRELSRPSYQVGTMAIGTNTDPYQPVEKRLEIMARILDVLHRFRHPVGIVTKGALIRRDLARLGEMAKDGLVKVGISLTTLDAGLCRSMEPRAASPHQRLRLIEDLASADVPVRAMIAPIIPGLTDHEIERLVRAAADAGASHASRIVLRLPLEVENLFRDWLGDHCPDRAERVMARVRDVHGGKTYDPKFGQRMRGRGVLADLIAQRFDLACKRNGLKTGTIDLRSDLFRVPGRGEQLSLL